MGQDDLETRAQLCTHKEEEEDDEHSGHYRGV
jgi:hypothetical protein